MRSLPPRARRSRPPAARSTLLREPKVEEGAEEVGPAPKAKDVAPRRRRDGGRREAAGRRGARPDVLLAHERVARARAPTARALHGRDPRALPPRLVDARAGRRLGGDQELLRQPGRHRPRPAQPVLGRRALAVLDLRARDHAVRHGVDHPAAPDRRHPDARAAAEGRRGRLRQDQPVHALPDGRARRGAVDSATRSCSSRSGRAARRTPAGSC